MARTSTRPDEEGCRLSCRSCPFRPESDLRDLGPAGIDLLQLGHDRRIWPAGSRVFRAGDPCPGVSILTRGLIAIRKVSPEGRSMIVRLVFPVRAFGLAAFLGPGRHGADAVVLSESSICTVGKRTVTAMIEQDPSVGRSLMNRLSQDLLAAEEAILVLGRMPVRERFLRLMLQLAAQPWAQDPDGDGDRVQFDLPLSRQDLASTLGIRPETLTRTIHELDGCGLIRIRGRRVSVPDLGGLLTAVGE
ncbi:MAG: Crp/Fnr family transcriptional regulator [Planctomycetota bacterium]